MKKVTLTFLVPDNMDFGYYPFMNFFISLLPKWKFATTGHNPVSVDAELVNNELGEPEFIMITEKVND